MTRVVVLGGGFAGMEAIRVLVFPRESAIMRTPPRCPVCHRAPARERGAA